MSTRNTHKTHLYINLHVELRCHWRQSSSNGRQQNDVTVSPASI